MTNTHPFPSFWQKILYWSLRLVIGLALFALLLVAVFVAINWKDEKLSPDALAILREPEIRLPDEKNGFYILREIEAANDVPLMETGIKEVKAEKQLASQGVAALQQYARQWNTAKAQNFSWEQGRCQKIAGNCVQHDLEHREELSALMAQNQLLAERYALMRAMPDYQEIQLANPAAMLPAYSPVMKAADMLITQAALDIADGKWEAGLQQLDSNDRQIRLMLSNSESLISKMVMQAALRRQARVVSELAVLYPGFFENNDEHLMRLVRSLTDNEKSLTAAYTYEARSQMNSFLSLRQATLLEDKASGKPFWPFSVLGAYAYHANASANRIAACWLVIIETSKQDARDINATRENLSALEMQMFGHGVFSFLNYVYNPVGKIVLQIAMPDQLAYLDRTRDMEAYLRLVSLQLNILSNKVPKADIASFVNHAPAGLRNPYDATPMVWDDKTEQLKFTGHERSSNNLDGGKISVVSLH